jgi:hypothetical protein
LTEKQESIILTRDFDQKAKERMMSGTILQDFEREVKGKIEQLKEELKETFDFSAIEQTLSEMLNELLAALLEKMITEFLAERSILDRLKEMGGRLGMRFKEYRSLELRLSNGQSITVQTPYFIKTPPKDKRRRKKRGPNGRGAHLGLNILGFMGHCSPQLVSEVVKLALLSPSFAIAREMLAGRGIVMDVKTMRRLCGELGESGLQFRGEISLAGTEALAGHTVVVGIDGGRLRERRKKPGCKKKGQKRQGYYTEWKEPKLFTIYVLDAQGEPVEEFAPLHDATLGNHQEIFALLAQYLKAMDLSEVARIVFCGDGASWIWGGVEKLCQKMGWPEELIDQVLDYTHAKQNLQEIIDLAPEKTRQKGKLERKWKNLLWNGDIQGLHQEMCRLLKGQKKKQALKKWRCYFEQNEKRMQYETFKEKHIPCGSGCVESAIRRVINLRLKSAGSFWTSEMAEYFLFLRSQLISGRWNVFFKM